VSRWRRYCTGSRLPGQRPKTTQRRAWGGAHTFTSFRCRAPSRLVAERPRAWSPPSDDHHPAAASCLFSHASIRAVLCVCCMLCDMCVCARARMRACVRARARTHGRRVHTHVQTSTHLDEVVYIYTQVRERERERKERERDLSAPHVPGQP